MTQSGRLAEQISDMTEAEVAARAINAEPWEPLPGMVKRQCPWCRYFFDTPADAPTGLCPDCAGIGRGAKGPRLPT